MEENNPLLNSLMLVFLAQMDSALKISKIISEHSEEEEISPDSIITGLVYRLMVSMDDEEMKRSMEEANKILNGETSEEEEEGEDEEEEEGEGGDIIIERNVKKNTCNCDICAKARACLFNYSKYEVTDQLAEKFKNAIDESCKVHKLNI